ncbi:MAG: hypothetical protein EOP85_21430 [Verrucomicrobiaceae bacterium]|nr:MAG: hypothetical protein EOP85_21430 [Verrucomicrobiaceae bacterium]
MNLGIATATNQEQVDLDGWKPSGLEFGYDDPDRTRVMVHTRTLKKGETLRLPTGNWTGTVLIFD